MKKQQQKKVVMEKTTLKPPVTEAEKKKFLEQFAKQKAFMTRHRKIGVLRRNKRSGKKISAVHQKFLIDSSFEAEKNFKDTVKKSIALVTGKKELNAFEDHFRKNMEECRMKAHPVFFSREVKKELKKIGLKDDELFHYYHLIFNTPNWDRLKSSAKKNSLRDTLAKAQKVIDSTEFPESAGELQKSGLLPVTGADDPVPYIVGAITVAVGAVAFVLGDPQDGLALMEGGGKLIADEAYQDITGTQDGDWSLNVKFKRNTSSPPPPSQFSPSINASVAGETASQLQVPSIPMYAAEYFLGNFSRSKMEVHRTNCHWLSLANPLHLQSVKSLDEAHSRGLDNCAYCLGNSKR